MNTLNGQDQWYICDNCAKDVPVLKHCGTSMKLEREDHGYLWRCTECKTTQTFEKCCYHPYFE